jgi:ATP-dependent Lon protease
MHERTIKETERERVEMAVASLMGLVSVRTRKAPAGQEWMFAPHYVEYGSIALPASVVMEMWKQIKEEREAEQKTLDAEIANQKQQDEIEDAADDKRRAASWPVPSEEEVPTYLKIFDRQEAIVYQQNMELGTTERENQRRAKALLKILETRGEYRQLATLSAGWRNELDHFENRFPNFAEVIDYVRIAAALAEQSDRVLHLCMLLSGPAGTGKSLFAQQLGEWVGGGFACVRYESAQSGSEMAGSSSFWSNTAPGKPFLMLIESEFANPTFFLDEIDKVSAITYDPLGALYALLEPGTAKSHADLSWPFLHLDCSRINYIAACNNPANIPQPLLSRLRKFEIAAPTSEQAMAIVDNIVTEERARHAPEIQFSEAAMHALCQLAPRRMRQIAQEALGRALFHQRDTVQAADIPHPENQQRGIGFLS